MNVADIEAEVLGLLSPFYARVGLDAATADGTNVDLRGPIRNALWHVGGTIAGGLAVTDDDLATLPAGTLERFLDVARLRAFEVCLGNWAKVDFSAGGNSQSLSQLTDSLHWWLEYLTKKVEKPIGPSVVIGGGPASVQPNSVAMADPQGRVVTTTQYEVFTPSDIGAKARDKIAWRGKHLTPQGPTRDAGGNGVIWVTTCTETGPNA